MRRKDFYIIALILAICSGCSNSRTIDYTTSWDTLRVLENPDKGWYHHLLDNGIAKYAVSNDSLFLSFPGMDHIYLRLAWSYLEPEEGKYDWHYIDEVVQKYVGRGYGISFRISGKETGKYPGSVNQEVDGVEFATPFWVKKAGAKGVVADIRGTKSWVPVWDDPVYLEKLDNFHRVFAERYDGKPWVRYVDIGSIGDWGEGHTSSSTKIPPTVEEVKANINVFLKNYKNSQLVCTDDLLYYGKDSAQVAELLNYAVSRGITLRDDSPLVDWYLKVNLKTWSVSHPHFYDPLYLKKPIIFELQHYSIVKKEGNWLGPDGADTITRYGFSGADIMRRAIATMHATYIGYHGYAEEWLTDNPTLSNELANLSGYWYFPVRVQFEKSMLRGLNTIGIDWLNKGVAPACNDYSMIIRIENAENKHKSDLLIEYAGNRNWLPGIVSKGRYPFFVPQETASGRYNLKFKLVKNTGPEIRPIDIGLTKNLIDIEGFAEIGTVTIKDNN